MRSRLAAALLAMLPFFVLAPAGCTLENAPQRELMETAGAWFTAIQERRFDLLARYDASAPKAGTPEYDRWRDEVNAILDRYEAQKLEGTWRPDPTGYALVRAMLIGANPGTFWGAPGREGDLAEPILIVQPWFAYDELAEQGYPPGTKVFVQGYPVGKVHRLEMGGEQREVDILDALRLRVYFRRNSEAGQLNEPDYQVVRAEMIEGSAKHRLVRWVY